MEQKGLKIDNQRKNDDDEEKEYEQFFTVVPRNST
jgi:hypothetical protein